MAERIQLRRTKGWRKPEGCIVVARPSRWGNPWKIADDEIVTGPLGEVLWSGNPRSAAVRQFQVDLWAGNLSITVADVRRELPDHDLACWCPLDQPCHADVLLALANGSTP